MVISPGLSGRFCFPDRRVDERPIDRTGLFVLLSTLSIPLCVIACWKAIQVRVKEYMVAFLVLETLMVGPIVHPG